MTAMTRIRGVVCGGAVLALLVGHLAAQDTTGSPLVFFLAGQSNMVGQGLTEELAPA